MTDPAAVVASLARVRKQGFATVSEENIRGVLSVGAPIRDRTGKVLAALSVAFPKYLDAAVTLQSITPLVVAAAQRISRAVGTSRADQEPTSPSLSPRKRAERDMIRRSRPFSCPSPPAKRGRG